MVLKRVAAFTALMILIALTVSLLAFSLGVIDPLTLTIRLLALNGYIALSIAAIMSPFLKEITLFFKKSFTKVHHYFAAVGLMLVTLLPITVFLEGISTHYVNPYLFLSKFSSIYSFFYYGGVIALILIYVGLGAAFLRRKIQAYWRFFHALLYLALFLGIVHANLIGFDFTNVYIWVLFDALFVAAMVAFGLNRLQTYRLKVRLRKIEESKAKTQAEIAKS